MAKRIIIATHTNLADGMKDALLFLAGETEVHTICAYTKNPTPEIELIHLLETFDPSDTVLVLTDLKGGSVNRIATTHLNKFNFHLVTGINLGLLLEIVLLPEEMINEISIRNAICSAQQDMCYMNDLMMSLKETGESGEEEFFM